MTGIRFAAAVALSSLAACGGGPPASAPAGEGSGSPIAEIHRHKCAKCHVLPEPKTRTREHLEDAFTRHRVRVHLTEEQWSAMVDYLAKP
ncbi:MAG TPA: hypothetical protein VGM06_03695 [Polyangiaceae bacterium]